MSNLIHCGLKMLLKLFAGKSKIFFFESLKTNYSCI